MDKYYDVLGVHISATNIDLACQQIEEWVRTQEKHYVCVAPVATVMDSQKDGDYRQVINQAGMVTPDGMPIVWLGKRRIGAMVGRTYGPDLTLAFCAVSQTKGYRHFFYGGTEETNTKLIAALKQKFPRLSISGSYAPPMRAVHEREDADILARINQARPDVLWVGLGSPKQDFWMAEHRELLDVPVMVGVGAAFDFLAGTKKQAPRWMQRSGLEWLFRLIQEPKRLWKRYLVGNSLFIYLYMKHHLFSWKRK